LRDLLRHHREERRLSQEELAALVEPPLSPDTISNLERGRTRPHRHTLEAVCQVLRLDDDAREAVWAAWWASGAVDSPASARARTDVGGRPASQPTPLIGREPQLLVLEQRLLQPQVRLLTLAGPGGVGKTRLALALMERVEGRFDAGARFVDLSALRDAGLVVPTIASALGIHDAGSQPVLQLLAQALRTRATLLALDNFEHLLEAAIGLAEVLGACPDLKVLVTSREPLRLRWEHLYVVSALGLPDAHDLISPDRVRDAPAVALFVERARAADESFAMTAQNAGMIAALCRRLDGLPLAIELAAAQVRTLSPAMLLDRIDRQLDLLKGAQDAPARQQTLRATLDWSYALLSPAEQVLFRRLAIFAAGWKMEAAEAICSDGAIAGDEIVELLVRLVDKSLVTVSQRDGHLRYRLLDILRAFGLEQLGAHRELEPLRARHAAFYRSTAEQAATALVGPNQATWLNDLEEEHDNLRAALMWANASADADTGTCLVASLGRFWDLRGHLTEGRQWAETFLGLGSSDAWAEGCASRTRLLQTASGLAMAQGDLAAAATFAEEGLALASASGNQQQQAEHLILLGHVARLQGQFDRSAACLEQSLAIQRILADPSGIARALEALATLASWQGQDEREAALRLESLALFRSVGDIRATAVALFWLGELACRRGEYGPAAALDEDSLVLFRTLGDERSVAGALAGLGDIALAQSAWQAAATRYGEALELHRRLGDREGVRRSVHGLACAAGHGPRPERAATLLGAANALAEALGISPPLADQHQYERAVVASRRQLSRAIWEAAWTAGRALALDQAIALAEGELGQMLPSTAAPAPASVVRSPLTSRQQEVAVLVAQGLTNRQIGQRLVVTEAAAAKHVEHILDKLGATSRAQIAAWVAERALLTAHPD
jgi:predicted ATPase/DNA-binding CsgD family transcriptional regulator/DNA-binding XRE family transcriptional regulator